MLDVRRDDRGPRVVLLQMMLNRRGSNLRVDGHFGLRTGRAVEDLSARLLSVRAAVAGPDLWMAIFREERLCGVDALDMGEANFVRSVPILRQVGSRVVETGAMCGGVRAVVESIRERSAPQGSLAILRTWGHGNNGRWMSFTVGEVVHLTLADPAAGRAVAAERESYVDPGNFHSMSPTLAPLRGCFHPLGSHEHHGCGLGHLAATRAMMGRLANLWQVPVTVAMGPQQVPFDSGAALRFQGQTFTAYPGGNEGDWIHRVVDGERRRGIR